MSRFGIVPFSHPFASYWREPRDAWDLTTAPSRIFEQRFGLGLNEDELLPASQASSGFYLRPRRQFSRQTSGLSEMKFDGNKFQVMLDVNQFTPEELCVKTVDNNIVVHGKHREKVDEHGLISREFTRRYVLPEGVEADSVSSSLSHDGILTIEAPSKAPPEQPKPNERVVPIAHREAPVEAATQSA